MKFIKSKKLPIDNTELKALLQDLKSELEKIHAVTSEIRNTKDNEK